MGCSDEGGCNNNKYKAKYNTFIGLSVVQLELQYPGFSAAWSAPTRKQQHSQRGYLQAQIVKDLHMQYQDGNSLTTVTKVLKDNKTSPGYLAQKWKYICIANIDSSSI